MPLTAPAYQTVAPLHRPLCDYSFVAPGADWHEIQFLASNALYSAQTDEVFAPELVELDSEPVDELTENSIILNQWALETAFQERDVLMAQLPGLREYYADISSEHIGFATLMVAYVMGHQLKPQSLSSHLTYNKSLHMRADLPQGTVHLSVIFEPGVDPTNPTPDEDGDDANTIVSLYDTEGVLRAGTSGPLPSVIVQLSSLAQWPVKVV